MALQPAVTAVKVPAALLSRSTAQLNDAAEEVLDVVASTAVVFGIRWKHERLANAIVVALMLATGLLTFALAVRRFVVPVTPTVSWYPLSVAIASVPIYGLRSAYERAAGLRGANEALVSQSVDSRNHALSGLGVTAGLLAVRFGAPVVDTSIGLVLSLTILKSCASLARDLVRSLRTGQTGELARYSFWVADDFQRMINRRLRTWLLHLVADEHITGRSELLARAEAAADPESNPLLQFGMEVDVKALVEPALNELIRQGLLVDGDPLKVTDRGRRLLLRTPAR
jgi:hypothetical protein